MYLIFAISLRRYLNCNNFVLCSEIFTFLLFSTTLFPNFTSGSKKEAYKKLGKSVVENRRKVKISLHKTKLLQFKYRRKKMAKIRYMSISGNFHVTSLLIKQYRSKNMTRSVKKVKFKGINKNQCSKRCRKITLIKYWLKKPWKEKIVDKIKCQAQYSC